MPGVMPDGASGFCSKRGWCGLHYRGKGLLRSRDIPELEHGELPLQVPVSAWEGKLWVRISAQYYNQLHEYHKLAVAVMALVKEGGRNDGETSWQSEDFQERLAAEVGTDGLTHSQHE